MPVVPPSGGTSWPSGVLVAWVTLGRSSMKTRNVRLRSIVTAIESHPFGETTLPVGRGRARQRALRATE